MGLREGGHIRKKNNPYGGGQSAGGLPGGGQSAGGVRLVEIRRRFHDFKKHTTTGSVPKSAKSVPNQRYRLKQNPPACDSSNRESKKNSPRSTGEQQANKQTNGQGYCLGTRRHRPRIAGIAATPFTILEDSAPTMGVVRLRVFSATCLSSVVIAWRDCSHSCFP